MSGTGPVKRTIINAFVAEKESIPFPDQCLNPVTALAAEKENSILIVRIQMELESYDPSQSFDPPAQVGVTCGNVDFFEIPGITQHGTSP